MDASPSNRGPAVGLITLAVSMAPALAAIAWVPEFVTQDGPAHVYNARILNASLGPGSPFAGTFTVAWQAVPNWAGHLGTMGLVAMLPPEQAGRLMAAITLVLLGSGVFWLRWTVQGSKGLVPAAIFSVLLALNVSWLLGFTSFLMGAALMPMTLALWWNGRQSFGPGRSLGLAALLVLGYFCHPISLGLTIAGLAILAILTPGPAPIRRGAWTASSLIPLIPLVLNYRSMTRSAGGLAPTWEQLAQPWLFRSWIAQFGWVDPISLAAKVYRPFSTTAWLGNGLISPAIWTTVAVVFLAGLTWSRRSGELRGWLVLATLLILGGLIGPDTLGLKHGHYMPQRVGLLGLVILVPWLDLDPGRRWTWLGTGMLSFALVVQSAFVWDYAQDCQARVGSLWKAGPAIGPGQGVGTLLVGIKGRFRANPILHADCLLGAVQNDLIWNNYETTHYYFPVKIQPGLEPPPALDFERIALLDHPAEAAERAGVWKQLLERHGRSIDVILEWGTSVDPRLDEINSRGYDPTFQDGPVRVWKRHRSEVGRDSPVPFETVRWKPEERWRSPDWIR